MGRPAKPEGERARDIAPTGVRLPPELRDALQRQATINGRSLSQEITVRLRSSLDGEHQQHSAAAPGAREPAPSFRVELSDLQRQALAVFDAMTPDRQLALLTLLKR